MYGVKVLFCTIRSTLIPWATGARQIVHERNYRGISIVLEQSEQLEQ